MCSTSRANRPCKTHLRRNTAREQSLRSSPILSSHTTVGVTSSIGAYIYLAVSMNVSVMSARSYCKNHLCCF